MKEDLTAILLADFGLSAEIGNRVHWLRLPDTVEGFPYLNLQGIDQPRSYHHQGQNATTQTRLQADIWAKSMASAETAADAFEALISGFQGLVGTTCIQGAFISGRRDLGGGTTGGVQKLFRIEIDFLINWNEEN